MKVDADIERHIVLLRNCAVIGMRNVLLLQGSCFRRRLRIFRGWELWRRRGKERRVTGGVIFYSGFLLLLWLVFVRAGVGHDTRFCYRF